MLQKKFLKEIFLNITNASKLTEMKILSINSHKQNSLDEAIENHQTTSFSFGNVSALHILLKC